jgi:hypothetical protein
MSWTIRGKQGIRPSILFSCCRTHGTRNAVCATSDPALCQHRIAPTRSDPTAAAPRDDQRHSVVPGSGWPLNSV